MASDDQRLRLDLRRSLVAALVISSVLLIAQTADATTFAVRDAARSSSACTDVGAATATVYLPNITKTLGGPSGWVTPFVVQNVGSGATKLEISFFRFSDGSQVTCRVVQALAPGAAVADVPNDDLDLPDDTQFSVVIRSYGAPIVASVEQTQSLTGGRVEALAYTGFTSGSTTVYVPNVTRRFYGYDVPLIMQNLGTALASVTATFTDFAHTQMVPISLTIPVGRSGVIDPDYTPGLVDGTQYAVKLVSSQPIGVVANAHNEAIGPVAFSYDGIAAGAQTLYAPYASRAGRVDIAGGYFFVRTDSPVVVQNMGATTTSATLTFYRLTGFAGGAPQSFTLPNIPPGEARAFDPRFPNGIALPGIAQCFTQDATCLGIGHYSLTISATTPIAAVVLPNGQTTSTGYLATSAATTAVALPIVRSSTSSWDTLLYIQSVTATSATMRFYSVDSGLLAVTKQIGLVPNTAIFLNPAVMVTGLRDGGVYSLVITGNGTLTAVADDYNFYASGDADMMFEGIAIAP